MFTISKEFSFCAAHHLDRLPPSHQCSRQHGHNYKVRVTLARDDESVFLDPRRWVRDYGDLRELKTFIDETLDHHDLNEVVYLATAIPGFTPTAEMIAYALYLFCAQRWPEVISVAVSETDNTWAEYRRDESTYAKS
jgi:6-pyruvoyltetrahydropterin/6-carboxytetrahydropterin synthase